MLKANEQKEIQEFKKSVLLEFVNSEAVSSRIIYFLTDPKKRDSKTIIQPWDVYPELFSEERAENDEAHEAAARLKHSMQMEAFAARWNKHRHREE